MALPTIISNAGNTAVQVSASTATVYGYKIVNPNSYTIYVKFYNKLAANVGDNDAPDLTVTVNANSTTTDTSSHAFATALSVRCTTRNVNSDKNAPAVPADIELELTQSGGGTSGLKPTDDIQTALNAASAGDVITLGPGTWDLGTGILNIPNDVHLVGAGQGVSIIKSHANTDTAGVPHGFIVPGNNTLIQDLSIIGYGAVGDSVNAFGCRTGGGKTWTNVIVRNCYVYGLKDTIFTSTADAGHMEFHNCVIDGDNDIITWQHIGELVLVNCTLRHTTSVGGEFLTAVILFNGSYDPNGYVKAYGCRFEVVGATASTNGTIIEGAGRVEVYDGVISYINCSSIAGLKDVGTDNTGGYTNIANVRRADGLPLVVNFGGGGDITVHQNIFSTTVAHLPVSPVVGQMAVVTDGTAALAWGATVTGGASTKYLVAWNGTNWTVIGK